MKESFKKMKDPKGNPYSDQILPGWDLIEKAWKEELGGPTMPIFVCRWVRLVVVVWAPSAFWRVVGMGSRRVICRKG